MGVTGVHSQERGKEPMARFQAEKLEGKLVTRGGNSIQTFWNDLAEMRKGAKKHKQWEVESVLTKKKAGL